MSVADIANLAAAAPRRDPVARAAAASVASALCFRRVEIRRMPGFETGGFVVEDLSPGINVLFGPNGCGKSRTAAAMNLLLWPHPSARRASIVGSFELGGSLWRVDLDSGQTRYQVDGTDAENPPALLPSPDARDRYNLPLQDLLGDAHDAFAQTILRESAGGFDLRRAVESLSFRGGPSTPQSLKKDLDAWRSADQAFREAERQQDAVRAEERTLADLLDAKSRAKQAAIDADVLRKALAFHEAGEKLAEADQRVSAFPESVARLKGDEWERHQELTRELAAARTERERAQRDHRDAFAARADCRLGDVGVPATLVPSLDEIRQRLSALRHQVETRETEHAQAQAERSAARAKIAPALSDDHLSRVVAGGVEPFADFARKSERARAEAKADEALSGWLQQASGDAPDGAGDLETVRQGVGCLQRWLSEPGEIASAAAPDRIARVLAFAAAGVLAVVAVILAVAVHPVWAMLVLAAIALVVPLFLRTRASANSAVGETSRATYARDFAQLGLAQPAGWTPDSVRTGLNALTQQLARRQLEHEKAARWAELQPRRKQSEALTRELTTLRERLANQLGVAPGIDDAAMYLLAGNVVAWQDADRRVATHSSALQQAVERFESELRRAADLLRPYGYAVSDPATLHAAVEDLRKRQQKFDTSTTRRDDAASRLGACDQRIAALDDKRRSFFESVGLAESDERTLEQWCKQHPRCREAMDQMKLVARDLENVGNALAGRDDLKSAPRAVIEADLREAQDLAATLDDVQHQIGQIDSRIKTAKGSDSVEAALCRKAEGAEQLKQRRADDCDAVAGWVLGEHLKRETRDTHRPAVFRGARELFQRITQGRWRLDFDDADPPAFRATETATETGHSLDELSSGTRLQLLLAVRVAFVEQQERGAKPPLFFDETLANSDEQRARAIIEAAIELSRAGRQVFYLTAQPDEVGKWKGMLESLGSGNDGLAVPYRLIDLAEVRGLAEHERLPLRMLAQLPDTAPPAPDGQNYDEYGRLLKVPGFDVAAASVGAVHLWHVMDDARDLHALLRRGLSTWGQLREFRKSALVADLAEPCARAEAAARALQAMSDAWKIGRGRRVDREAIEESGAVTSVFQEPVCRLLESVDGDARRLLESLEDRKVPRFRGENIEQVREHLLKHGYLDERPVLSREEVRLQMLAAVAGEIATNTIDAGRIDRYLETWWRE